jgi:hypothetical protein
MPITRKTRTGGDLPVLGGRRNRSNEFKARSADEQKRIRPKLSAALERLDAQRNTQPENLKAVLGAESGLTLALNARFVGETEGRSHVKIDVSIEEPEPMDPIRLFGITLQSGLAGSPYVLSRLCL